MKVQRLSFLLALIICSGCVKRPPENLLVGGLWVTEYNRHFGWWNRWAFEFINDSIVDTKHNQYFEYDTTAKKPFFGFTEKHFFGSKTKYRFEKDSLRIYDPGEKKWSEGIKIMRVTTDTLVLASAKRGEEVFTRKFYNLSTKTHFDRIVLSAGPCFGTCPIVDIIVEPGGNVFLRNYGPRNVHGYKYYESQISSEKFKEIEENFLRVDESRLRSYYNIGGTDQPTISTIFCSNNRIRKSVTDYGPCGPDELVWAYPELEYLYLSLELKEIPNEKLPLYVQLGLRWIEHGKQEIDLTEAENFLLSYYLMKGSLVLDQTVQAKYIINDVRDFTLTDPINERSKILRVESDGRYFKFYERKGNSYVIDLGFNFLDENYQILKDGTLARRNFEQNVY